MNYDVRSAIAASEKSAARSNEPEATFSQELGRQIMGSDGLRNRYLENSDSGRGTWDYAAPVTSMEQSTILKGGRFTTDRDHSGGDGDPTYKTRKD
jgi:conjugal transfer mating pair stabilization protein TraG